MWARPPRRCLSSVSAGLPWPLPADRQHRRGDRRAGSRPGERLGGWRRHLGAGRSHRGSGHTRVRSLESGHQGSGHAGVRSHQGQVTLGAGHGRKEHVTPGVGALVAAGHTGVRAYRGQVTRVGLLKVRSHSGQVTLGSRQGTPKSGHWSWDTLGSRSQWV